MTDREIIELFFNRDERGIAEVQKAYGNRLLHFAERYLSKEDAEECVNDTYLLLWKHIPPAEPEHFYAYIVKILRNQALSRMEKLNAQKRKADLIELSDELAECLPDRGFSIWQNAFQIVAFRHSGSGEKTYFSSEILVWRSCFRNRIVDRIHRKQDQKNAAETEERTQTFP